MRHTFACQRLARGDSLAALQLVLGHASIETTQRYAKLTDDAVMQDAMQLADDYDIQTSSQPLAASRYSLWPRSSDG